MKKILLVAIMCGAGLMSKAAYADADMDAARALLAQGQAKDAYERLAPLEFNRSGEVEFDYLFGLVALGAGHANQATLAFERVLAVDPNYAAAYVDMGRAYYALGDLERAEQSFATARQFNPTPQARATMSNYEKAIAARRDPKRLHLSGYVDASWGRDSNVNQATSSSSISIPAFGGTFSLGSASLAQRDNYGAAKAGGEAQFALNSQTTLYATGELQRKDYAVLNSYDATSADLRTGVAFSSGKSIYRLAAGYNDYRLENDRYRTVATAEGEWRYAFDGNTFSSLSTQYNQIRYVSDTLRSNDVNFVLIGAGLSHVIPGERRKSVYVGAFAGREREDNVRFDGNRALGGLRMGATVALDKSVDFIVTTSAQVGLYSRVNSLFLTRRRDTQYDIGLGTNWRFASLCSLRPQIGWTRIDSNLGIYDTNRYDFSLSLRRDFR